MDDLSERTKRYEKRSATDPPLGEVSKHQKKKKKASFFQKERSSNFGKKSYFRQHMKPHQTKKMRQIL